jgi:hypothetical protein
MPALTPQQQEILAKCEKITAQMDALEKLASESPAERAARLGAESATGSEAEIESSNRKFKRELQDPTFAKNYFAAQRIARNKVRRMHSMVRGPRTFKLNGCVVTEPD